MKKSRVVVFLGAGGVGKTTLAAGYALSLAKSGLNVGLLSIDPAKRLQTALGLPLMSDDGVLVDLPFASSGSLKAAVLNVQEAMKRWVHEEDLPKEVENKILDHIFFRGLTEKLASSTDTFAAVRMAEWLEKNREIDVLVVDTAPGMHALDFLLKPDRLLDFFDSKIIEWLKKLSPEKNSGWISSVVRFGSQKMLDGLSVLGGKDFILRFAEFVKLLEHVFERLSHRLAASRLLLRGRQASFYLIASVRPDSVSVARDLAHELDALNIHPERTIVNRCIPLGLQRDQAFVKFLGESFPKEPSEQVFAGFVNGYLRCQKEVFEGLHHVGLQPFPLEFFSGLGLEGDLRLIDLARMGDSLRQI